MTERRARILVVSQYFWPETFRVNDLVRALRDHGHAVAVLTGNPNYPAGAFLDGYGGWRPRRDAWHDVPVARVPHLARGTARGLRLAANYASFALSACVFGPALVRRHRPDVILVNQLSPLSVALPGLLLGRICRVPVAMWVQDLWPESVLAVGAVRKGRTYDVLRRLSAAIHRRCDVLYVQSEAFVAPLVAQGVARDRIRYLPNWAESLYLPTLVSADAPERAELPDGFVVLFAGNIGTAQGFETVLGAAEQLTDIPDLHWVVLGDGRQAAWLAAEVERRRLSGHVHLLGRRPVEVMPTYYGLADALLVSLRSDPVYDMTIPSKVQSYLASGRPVVASLDGEGARVVAESGAGIVARADDAAALADSVRRLYAMGEDERAAMGRRGRVYYEERFDRAKVVARAEAYLEELCAERVS